MIGVVTGGAPHWAVSVIQVAAAIKAVALAHTVCPPPLVGLEDGPVLVGPDRITLGVISAIDLLEQQSEAVTLFPNGNRGMPLALLSWARAAETGGAAAFESAVGLIDRQLADGRPFLQGDAAGLADAASFGALASADNPPPSALVAAWQGRLKGLISPISGNAHSPAVLSVHAGHVPAHRLPFASGQTREGIITDQRLDTVDLLLNIVPGGQQKALPLTCDRAFLKL